MTHLAAVLLDLDGTLVDSNEFHVSSWRQAFAEAGYELPAEVIRHEIGKGADQLVPSLLPGASAETGPGKQIARRHGEIFKSRYLRAVQPFPDATEFVRGLHAAGVKPVLASSASGEEVDHYARLLGIEDIIAARTSSDDVVRTKPAGDIFAAALQKLPYVAPSDVVVIGDTPYDVIAALRCDLRAIGLLSGGFAEVLLREAGAIAVYRDVRTLRASWRELTTASAS